MKRRVLLVGRSRFRLPLTETQQRKFDALREVVDLRVLATSLDGVAQEDETFVLEPSFAVRPLDGVYFYAALPARIARELKRFRPDAILTQSPYEAAAALTARRISKVDARIVLEVHGDWRTLTRLYGSPARRAIQPLADELAATAVRRADAVRTISAYTTRLVEELGVEPTAVFPAFMDLEPFLDRPVRELPETPTALFVGVLELYKNVDGLADAWRRVADRMPRARLRIVGRGSRAHVVERLVHDLPENIEWVPQLATDEVAQALDAATVLVLPSRSEGMGRVIVEAFCRGRGVIGTRVGGIPDLVEDQVNGILVPPGDGKALEQALLRVLSNRGLAQRLGAAARESAVSWTATPQEYAERVRDLVERAVHLSA